MADEHDTTVWGFVIGGLFALAVGLTAIEGVIHPGHEFSWMAGIMIAAYVLVAVAGVLLVGLLLRWTWLVGKPPPQSPPPAPAKVTNHHAARLRDAAKGWSDRLKESLDPDWALPAANLFELRDYAGLKALQLHFPGLKTFYDQYQSLDNALPTTFLRDVTLDDGRQCREPTTPEGVEALQKRNEAARAVIEKLDEIRGMTEFTVGCGECEGDGNKGASAIVGIEM